MDNLKIQQLRNNEYYNMQAVLDDLYDKSCENQNFKSLINTITSDNNILLAYRNLKSNRGSYTPGVDGKNIDYLDKLKTEDLIKKVRGKFNNYKTKNIKRVYIPKQNGSLRPLGIPTIMDRLIQQCIKQILEPICEAKFHNNSYGFRPDRSTENAIACLYKYINLQKLYYVVNVDIKSFFDNINHRKLRKQIWNLGIQDKKLISIINEMLKANTEINGVVTENKSGTPQGGILSPLLSNIVLNELDWWISSQWETIPTNIKKRTNPNGSECNSQKYRELRKTKLKEMFIVRYADDFKILCKSKEDAEKVFYALKEWLHDRLHLEINLDKSSIVDIRKGKIEFLGFEIGTIKKNNKYVVKSNISEHNKNRIVKELRDDFRNIKYDKNKSLAIDNLNLKIIGLHNYYNKATFANLDFSEINYRIQSTFYNRYKNIIKREGNINNKFIEDKYGKSDMIRFIYGKAIVPVAFIKHKNPMFKDRNVNRFTSIGRTKIHENLKFNINSVKELLFIDSNNTRVEYHNNRIAKYCSQYGMCYITNKFLNKESIHCHHIIPYSLSKDDSYNNLIILDKDIHILVHSTEDETISKYLKIYNLDTKQIKKINKLRIKLNLNEIDYN